MRDDIGKLPIPASARRYARMTGAASTSSPGKFNRYTKMVADLVNGGNSAGFRSKDAVGPVASAAKTVVERLIRGE